MRDPADVTTAVRYAPHVATGHVDTDARHATERTCRADSTSGSRRTSAGFAPQTVVVADAFERSPIALTRALAGPAFGLALGLRGGLNTAPQNAGRRRLPLTSLLAGLDAGPILRAARREGLASPTTLDLGPRAARKRLTTGAARALQRQHRPDASLALAIQRAAETLAITVFASCVTITQRASVDLCDAAALPCARLWRRTQVLAEQRRMRLASRHTPPTPPSGSRPL